MKNKDLERAVTRLKNGDKTAFDYIYENTVKVVYFVVHNILRNKALTEDIVQDAYIVAYKKIDLYQSDNILAWLTTIAKRLAYNDYNHRKREVLTDFANDYTFKSVPMPDVESRGIIDLAEKSLSEEDFQILIMCAVAGYKRREVSDILDIPISTVSFRYQQALRLLKQKLS